MLEAIIAMTIKYRPVDTWNAVEIETLDQGEITENPTPAPKARSIRLIAAAAAPPARIAGHDTADTAASSVTPVSMMEAFMEQSLAVNLWIQRIWLIVMRSADANC